MKEDGKCFKYVYKKYNFDLKIQQIDLKNPVFLARGGVCLYNRGRFKRSLTGHVYHCGTRKPDS